MANTISFIPCEKRLLLKFPGSDSKPREITQRGASPQIHRTWGNPSAAGRESLALARALA